MRRKKAIIELSAIVLVAILALGWTFKVDNKPFLGLDLQGGLSVVLKPDTTDDEAISQAIVIMNQRINSLGVAEPDIHREGDNIVVQIAGVDDQQKALDLVGQTAELRFRPVLATLAPDSAAGATTGTTPGSTPGTAPTGTAPVDPSASTVAPSPAAVSPGTSEVAPAAGGTTQNGMGAAEGESAAGAQAPPTTISDQNPTTTAGVTPAPSTTVAAVPTAGAAPTAAAGDPTTTAAVDPTASLTPEQLAQIQAAQGGQTAQVTTTPEEDARQESLEKTVILPQVDPLTGEQQLRYQLGPAGYTGPDGKFVPLTGAALEGASAGLDTQTGQWLVRPKFKPGEEGIDRFNALSAKCYAKAAECPTGQMAITLDGKVISAPSINAASFGADQIQISGSFTEDTAKALATALKYGALPVKLDRLSSERVSATLGQDALTAGLVAGFVGLLLVSIYMIAFYRLLGVLAILKLAVEGALLWAIISFLGSTVGLALTLAGVTGIIVSIGVSLDSNVVYYEHLREDTRNGRTIRSAVDRSFHNAIGTILKADGASLLGAALLYWLAIGPVRGFAFYLGLSTVLDLISSYLYMRPIVFLATGSKLCQRHPAWFGLPASAGTEAPPPSASRPSRSRSGSAPPGDGGSGRRSRRGSATALAERTDTTEATDPAPGADDTDDAADANTGTSS